MITKVLVANASEAHLFNAEHLRTEDLRFIKNFSHPESRKKITELLSDKPGFCSTSGNTATAYESKHSAKEVEAEHFALELIAMIHENSAITPDEKLLIVAPINFYNLFTKHWHHHVPKIEHLAKDYTKFTIKELTAKLREYLFVQ